MASSATSARCTATAASSRAASSSTNRTAAAEATAVAVAAVAASWRISWRKRSVAVSRSLLLFVGCSAPPQPSKWRCAIRLSAMILAAAPGGRRGCRRAFAFLHAVFESQCFHALPEEIRSGSPVLRGLIRATPRSMVRQEWWRGWRFRATDPWTDLWTSSHEKVEPAASAAGQGEVCGQRCPYDF
eukprot:1726271-Prymnesium_polylepis.1